MWNFSTCLAFLLMVNGHDGGQVKTKVNSLHTSSTAGHQPIPWLNGDSQLQELTFNKFHYSVASDPKNGTDDLILDQLSVDTSTANQCHHLNSSLSSDSLILTQKVRSNLLLTLQEMTLQLESYTVSRLTHLVISEDVFTSKKILDQDLLDFKSFEEPLFSKTTTKKQTDDDITKLGKFIKKFIVTIQSMGCQLSPALIRRTMDQLECLYRIKLVTPNLDPSPSSSVNYIDPSKILGLLTPISNLIRNEQMWLDFLINLFEDLSDIEVQVYNKLNLKKDWTTATRANDQERNSSKIENRMIFFEKSSFENFWLKFSQLPSLWHRDEQKMWQTLLEFNGQFKIDTLNQLLMTTLDPQLDINRHHDDPSHVIVQANFVTLSKVLDELPLVMKTIEKKFDMKILTIIASHTIFIDTNLIATKLNHNSSKFSLNHSTRTSLTLATIAPNWWIDGTRTIKLDGVKGNSEKIVDENLKIAGHHGQPGLPGGPGGHFFGISHNIFGDKLLISVNGGRGGPGQAGIEGSNGRNGSHVSLNSVKCDAKRPGGKNLKNFVRIDFTPYGHNESGCRCDSNKKQCGPYIFHGEAGQPGGKGGDGGLGGMGGFKGSSIFVQLNQNDKNYSENVSIVMRQPSNGRPGHSGLGGMGGHGGISGRSIQTDVKSKYNFWQFEYTCYFVHQQILAGVSAQNGPNGVDGGNGRRRDRKEVAETSSEFNFVVHARQLNIFKTRAFTQIQNGNKFLTHFLHNFLIEIDNNNNNIEKIYDPVSLFEEFSILESLTWSSNFGPNGVELLENNQNNLLQFLNSLLEKTHRTASKVEKNEKNILQNLAFLYTTILSKICTLRAPSDPLLVINIENSLQKILTTLETLKVTMSNEAKYSVVRAHKENYETQIQEKITEAHTLIENFLEPQINQIEHRIEANVERLIDEIILLQKNSVTDLKNLAKAEEGLRRQVKFSAIFGGLRTLTQFLYFLGPQGAIAATFIGKGLGCAESFLPSANPNGDPLLTKIPSAIKNMYEAVSIAFKSFAETRLIGFEEQLKEVQKILTDSTENSDLNDLRSDVDKMQLEVRTKMEKIGGKNEKLTDLYPGNVEIFQKLQESENFVQNSQKNLQTALESKKNFLEKKVTQFSQKKVSILSALSKVGLAIRVVEVGSLSYKKFTEDREKLKILADQIEKVKGQLEKIQKQIQSVHTILTPTVQSMLENMQDFRLNLANQSSVALQISKWQVTKGLKELKEFIQSKFTQGFEIDEEMGRSLDLMTEVVTTLINIFDQLQRYEEEAQLANFMANIVTLENDSDKDKEDGDKNLGLAKQVKNLELILQSNLILSRYEEAMRSFKMWVFPFAGYYSDDLPKIVHNLNFTIIIDNFSAQTSLTDLATSVGSNVEKLMTKLNYYKNRVGPYDQFLHHKAFYPTFDNEISKNGSTSAQGQGKGSGLSFYVWKSDEFGPLILRLLSGEKIVLKAPIEKSPTNMNAIKFRRIDLNFRIQSEKNLDGVQAQQQQQELWGHLRHFKVNLTHTGNSYYRFRNKVHIISSKQVSISFSFELYNGLPAERNQVYEKLRQGDLVLSPYTFWEIQLLPMETTGGDGASFQQLARLANNYPINLELNGEGTFVDEELDIDPMALGRPYYYERDVVVTPKVDRNQIEEASWDFVSNFWPGWGP